MITTVSDFLEQFKKYALSKIERDEKDITHRPTIGNIFEGLTAKLLEKAIFKNFNLKIVERSFIYNDSGEISAELDCMLVIGDGVEISFTNQFKYHIKDVIAVFQVKKNLYANDIDDSHHNLRSVIKISEPRHAEPFVGNLHRDAYRLLTSKEFPTKERRSRFNDRENIIYHFLMMEAFYPLRIVIGYYGYSTEFALREGFSKKLEEILKNGPVRGYSPGSFPNLYICGNSSIIKSNGMPYGVPFKDEEFYWHILTSSFGKPMYHLLELIWTRLSYKFEISSEIFGDDDEIEAVHPFLSCKERKISEDSWGWEFMENPLSNEQLLKPLNPIPWKPTEVTTEKFSILWTLSKLGQIEINKNEDFLRFIKTKNLDASKIIKEMEDARLVYVDEGIMGLLVDELILVTAPDGKMYAGENKSGEMTNYFGKEMITKSNQG